MVDGDESTAKPKRPTQAKDKASELAAQAVQAAGPLAAQARERAGQVAEKVGQAAGPRATQAKEKVGEVAEKVGHAAAHGLDAVAGSLNRATGGKYQDRITSVSGKLEHALERTQRGKSTDAGPGDETPAPPPPLTEHPLETPTTVAPPPSDGSAAPSSSGLTPPASDDPSPGKIE
jgi:hypothetical protein